MPKKKSDLPWIDDGSGVRRVLACLPPRPDFGGLPKFGAAVPVIPQSEWYEINRRKEFNWVMDQSRYSSCVGQAGAGGLRRARALQGQTDVALSPACLYAQINGGQDRGAIISDALTALLKNGTCKFSTVGQTPFYWSQIPPAARKEGKRFRIELAYHATTFDELGTGLILKYIPVYGIMVGDRFNSLDKHGVAGHTPGVGNHAMHADGLRKLPDGRWVLDNVNSWGTKWGQGGRCFLDEEHFSGGVQPDAFLIKCALADPENPNEPPAVT